MNPRLMKAPCVRPEKVSEMSLITLDDPQRTPIKPYRAPLDDPHRTLIKPYRILVESVECLESLYGGPEDPKAPCTHIVYT